MKPREVGLTWIWDVSGPLHVGSGLSRAGYADLLIARDSRGFPVVPGDAVRGALRMGAEQVIAWLTGRPEQYDTVAHPRHWVLRALFGPEASHFSPIYPTSKGGDRAAEMTVDSTAVDGASGCARDNTLRVTELLVPETLLNGQALFFHARFQDGPVVTLLCASLLAVESIGGGAGRGWGRLHVRPNSMRLSTGASIADQITEERLSALTDALGGAEPEPGQRAFSVSLAERQNLSTRQSSLSRRDQSRWWKLVFTLVEPTCIGNAKDVSNKLETQEWIPATGLRGALQAVWRRCGLSHDDLQPWFDANTRWTPAWIAEGQRPAAPAPLSWMREKHAEGLDGPHGLHDALSGISPARQRCCDLASASGALQWKATGSVWLDCVSSRPNAHEVRRELGMHVARDYVTRSKRSGALWARESLSHVSPEKEPVTFVAYARLPCDQDDWPQRAYLGRRVSANGAVNLEAKPEEPWFLRGVDDAPNHATDTARRDVFVQLLAPAILRDSETGHCRRGLPPEAWPGLAGVDVELEAVGFGEGDAAGSAAFTASKVLGSWMRSWGHGRAPARCIDAGSAWRLRCKSASQAKTLRSALVRLARDGLGERCHEGFGWFAVDPQWLGHHLGHPCTGDATVSDPPSSVNPRQGWPGMEALPVTEVDRLTAAVNALGAEAIPVTLKAPLQELLTHARAGRQPTALLKVCEQRGNRTRRKADGTNETSARPRWTPLLADGAVRKLLEREQQLGREGFMFLLDALLVRCRGQSNN